MQINLPLLHLILLPQQSLLTTPLTQYEYYNIPISGTLVHLNAYTNSNEAVALPAPASHFIISLTGHPILMSIISALEFLSANLAASIKVFLFPAIFVDLKDILFHQYKAYSLFFRFY